MTKAQRHPWRQPSELDDLFLYHLARLMSSTGTMVVRLCEGGFGITRREWRMVGLLATKGAMQPSRLAELAQLALAHPGEGERVEDERHGALAGEVGQRDVIARPVLQGERGRRLADLGGHTISLVWC